MVQRQLLALLISGSPYSVDVGPWLSLQCLCSRFELSSRGPIVAIVVPTNNPPFRRIPASNVNFELQTSGQYGLRKEFTCVGRVKLIPLINPVPMVDQWIATCDQEAVVFGTCSGLLIIS